MPRAQWPLLRGRPIVELTLTTALGGQQVVRRLIADTGAGSLRSGVELLLDEQDCLLCGGIRRGDIIMVVRQDVEPHFEREIQFLGEQDGEIERVIKSRWTRVLGECKSVARAYLAIVSYDRSISMERALCLACAGEDYDERYIVARLASEFAQVFGAKTSVDIMFLSTDQEFCLQQVCRAFYIAQQT